MYSDEYNKSKIIVEDFFNFDENQDINIFLRKYNINLRELFFKNILKFADSNIHLFNVTRSKYYSMVYKYENNLMINADKIMETMDKNDLLFKITLLKNLPLNLDTGDISKINNFKFRLNLSHIEDIKKFMIENKMDKKEFYAPLQDNFLVKNSKMKVYYKGVFIDSTINKYLYDMIDSAKLPKIAGSYSIMLDYYVQEKNVYDNIVNIFKKHEEEGTEMDLVEFLHLIPYKHSEHCYEINIQNLNLHKTEGASYIINFMNKYHMNDQIYFQRITNAEFNNFEHMGIYNDEVRKKVQEYNLPLTKGIYSDIAELYDFDNDKEYINLTK